MKTIMLTVHDDEGQEARFQCALDVARAVGGRLHCLNLMRLPMVVDAVFAPNLVELDDVEREDRLIARVEERLASEGVPHEWGRVHGDFDGAIADNARLVDLIVVSDGGIASLGDQNDLAGRVARLVDVPILVVPQGQRGFDLFGRVMVAWDGSAPADAAIRAAVPLLRFASLVEVVTIDDGSGGIRAEEAARYLAEHGCKAEARTVMRNGTIAAQLVDEIAACGAGWAVMGCYGHARMREMLFGGTTRSLLAEAPVPLLIAH